MVETQEMTGLEVREFDERVPPSNGAEGLSALKTIVTIKPPNLQTVEFLIEGTAPYVQHAFGDKARQQIHGKQVEGSTAASRRTKTAKDFKQQYEDSMHRSIEGWIGVPATAFRNALISACRTVNYAMTRAKLAIFAEQDGYEVGNFKPLVRFTRGEPEYFEDWCRLSNGEPDLHARPLWKPGWQLLLRLKYDADMFRLEDIAALLMRAGAQVGIGEGRHDSKKSAGQGWGTFKIVNEEPKAGRGAA